jgi:hypothetical protein
MFDAGYQHFDIKNDNLMTDLEVEQIYIIDLGLSGKNSQYNHGGGTPHFMSMNRFFNTRNNFMDDLHSYALAISIVYGGYDAHFESWDDVRGRRMNKMLGCFLGNSSDVYKTWFRNTTELQSYCVRKIKEKVKQSLQSIFGSEDEKCSNSNIPNFTTLLLRIIDYNKSRITLDEVWAAVNKLSRSDKEVRKGYVDPVDLKKSMMFKKEFEEVFLKQDNFDKHQEADMQKRAERLIKEEIEEKRKNEAPLENKELKRRVMPRMERRGNAGHIQEEARIEKDQKVNQLVETAIIKPRQGPAGLLQRIKADLQNNQKPSEVRNETINEEVEVLGNVLPVEDIVESSPDESLEILFKHDRRKLFDIDFSDTLDSENENQDEQTPNPPESEQKDIEEKDFAFINKNHDKSLLFKNFDFNDTIDTVDEDLPKINEPKIEAEANFKSPNYVEVEPKKMRLADYLREYHKPTNAGLPLPAAGAQNKVEVPFRQNNFMRPEAQPDRGRGQQDRQRGVPKVEKRMNKAHSPNYPAHQPQRNGHQNPTPNLNSQSPNLMNHFFAGNKKERNFLRI